MTSPTIYTLSYDFTSFQSANPSTPLPADQIEIQFNDIATTTGEIITNLNLLQKSDGTLVNGVVKAENLATELTIGLASPVAWSNGAAYAVNDTVIEANALYRCAIAHTSSVFATDLAAAKWILVADYSDFLTDAEAAKDAAETAQTAAELAETGAENALDEFTDIYLGAKSSDPTVDNDGNALTTGAFYWNTSTNSIRVYNGSAFGDSIGATNLPVFVYTATGGETSVSGADDNANTLAYTPGKIQVYINGVLETQNVTATTGTSITGITALSASDVVEIYAFESITVLEDVVSHTTVTPTPSDFLVFADVSDTNIDRKATIGNIVRANGVINGATSASPAVADEFLFGDNSDSNNTKKATLADLIALVPTVPTGSLTPYAGSAAPSGWLMCYGQEVNRTTYATLYALIGTTYGSGDGSTTFNLPDLRGRVAAGKDNMGGTSADRLTNQSGGVDGDGLGNVGGDETHALVAGENAAHTHDSGTLVTASSGSHSHTLDFSSSGTGGNDGFQTSSLRNSISSTNSELVNSAGSHTHAMTGATASQGSGTAHNNVQPTIILNYIIKT
jgi:microcystin-dependent protein